MNICIGVGPKKRVNISGKCLKIKLLFSLRTRF